jgi:succinylarginine dihydrolase
VSLVEINYDGIVGPSHNYAGLSPGNLAATGNAGKVSHPRAAALQGIAKMRGNLALGLNQGVFLPQPRPDSAWFEAMGLDLTDPVEPHLLAAGMSASSMWAANAATVSPAPDTRDGVCHLTPANLLTMPHRAHEWQHTLTQLQQAFPGFAFHAPVPAPFGDEGAANHMRLCRDHASPGVEVFVYGVRGGPFPARQHIEASKAVARLHEVHTPLFVAQSEEAIAAGAFHNDVVAVSNERVLFAHEQAFADKAVFFDALRDALPEVEIIEVPASAVSLADAIQSYLFNAQLVTLPGGEMALIVPTETQDNVRVWTYLQALVAGNGPIRRLAPVDVRESMANGGGPACLRLRVVANPETVDPRFRVDDGKLDLIAQIVTAFWPEEIAPVDLGSGALHRNVERARTELCAALGIPI